MKNADKPIHPVTEADLARLEEYPTIVLLGLTKRELFAYGAMKGLVSNSDWTKTMQIPDDWDDYKNRLTQCAVELADELINKLK